MDLALLAETYTLARLDRDAEPPRLPAGPLSALVRDRDGLTLVAPESAAPESGEASKGWRAFEVAGPLDLSTTGVLAGLAEPLRVAGVPIFVVSSFGTDFVLVPGERLADAIAALEGAGHAVAAANVPETPL
jgi:hypothetical protein